MQKYQDRGVVGNWEVAAKAYRSWRPPIAEHDHCVEPGMFRFLGDLLFVYGEYSKDTCDEDTYCSGLFEGLQCGLRVSLAPFIATLSCSIICKWEECLLTGRVYFDCQIEASSEEFFQRFSTPDIYGIEWKEIQTN